MIHHEAGQLRPWELALFTPAEVNRYAEWIREMNRERSRT